MDLERCKKDAKALVRAYRDSDPEAVGRAEKVLGHRARDRFQLSDAQHVVAVERGHRTWPELRQAAARARANAKTRCGRRSVSTPASNTGPASRS